ncbi:MAE_28990/MAE_18760 family HEPN-like nuclease [Nocardia sp. NPDC055002]
MPKKIDDYFDDIDSSRSLRVRELSEVKRIFGASSGSDPLGVRSKALVVLSYAAWEGFYNECVDFYCDFLQMQGRKVSDAGWPMLVGALEAEFESLRSRNHSASAKRQFVDSLKARLACDFGSFDRKSVKARSNLNWEKLEHNFQLLSFEISPFFLHRNRLDREVVGWRHGVAHGDAPNLGSLDVEEHIKLVSEVMRLVADAFQEAMLEHI